MLTNALLVEKKIDKYLNEIELGICKLAYSFKIYIITQKVKTILIL